MTAGILAFEGLDPIGHDLRLLRLFRALGVTIASLTWSNRNPFADGSSTAAHPGGLTRLGEEVIAELERLRILIDLAHLGPTATEEVLERATQPLFLSHTRPMDDQGRGASPTTLRHIAEGGGVACAIFYRIPTVDALVDLARTVAGSVRPGRRRPRRGLLRHPARARRSPHRRRLPPDHRGAPAARP